MLELPASLIVRAFELEAQVEARVDRWLEARARRFGEISPFWFLGAASVVFLEAAVGCAVVGWRRHAIAFAWGGVVYGAVLLLLWWASRRPQE